MSDIIVDTGNGIMFSQLAMMMTDGPLSNTAKLHRELFQLPAGYQPPEYFILTHPDHFLEIVAVKRLRDGRYEIPWRHVSWGGELLVSYIFRRYIPDIWRKVVMMPDCVLANAYTIEHTGNVLVVSFAKFEVSQNVGA